jgi:L-iditol 2-dehydrogenase
VCGSDTHYYEHGRIGRFVVEAPLVLGHEAAGEVTDLGPGVTRLVAGQRVSIEPGVPDLTCEQCLAGRYNLCPTMRFFGTPPVDGALAEYVVVHEAFAHPVPCSVGDDAAALLEPLSVGIWACMKARVTAGSRVLITGAGPIGLVSLQAALAFGATEVVVSDVNPARLALAKELGATTVIDGSTSIGWSPVPTGSTRRKRR